MDTVFEATLSPAEFAVLSRRDLSGAVCVVLDILRATSSMVTGLANGARGILPAGEIEEALAHKTATPQALLAGERGGLRITAELTGSVDFDLGNSPREFTSEAVRDRTLVMTTTNGTRALRASEKAASTLVASFLNLGATIQWLEARKPERIILVCAGTEHEPALEDVIAAGAFCDALWPASGPSNASDGAYIARRIYSSFGGDVAGALRSSRNGKRLLAIPALREDVAFCAQRDIYPFVALLEPDGVIRKS